MSILQEQPREPAEPSQIAAALLERPPDLEYPHAPQPAKARNSPMPLILWGLALLLGILMRLVRTPLHVQPFESVTEYACDPLPRLPNLGNRFQSYRLNLRCRAANKSSSNASLPMLEGPTYRTSMHATAKAA